MRKVSGFTIIELVVVITILGILAAVALHLLAVLAYRLLKGQDLLRPMVTGAKDLPAERAANPPRMGNPALAAALLGAAAALVYGVTRFGPP